MNNLNSILLEGNLSREPELRYTRLGSHAAVLGPVRCLPRSPRAGASSSAP